MYDISYDYGTQVERYILCRKRRNNSTVTDVVMVRNFDVVSDEFNVSRICILLMSSSKSNKMIAIIIEITVCM